MNNFPAAGSILFSAKDAVRLYVNPALNSTKSDEVFNSGEQIGTVTGNHISNSQGEWFSVNVVVSSKKANPWLNLIPVAGTIAYGAQLLNQGNKTADFWVRVGDGNYQIIEDSSTDAAQAANDAAALKAKQKQALIDAVGTTDNANLTANSGTTATNSSIYWIVGGVLVFVAGLVTWKLASKPKAVAVAPTYKPAAPVIAKPAKLR